LALVPASLLARGGIDRCRFVVGLTFSRSSRQTRAVLLASSGHALSARVEVVGSQVRKLPRRLARVMAQPSRARASIAALLAAELAEVGASVVGDLCAAQPQFERRLLAIGVTEPGVWGRSRGGLIGYSPVVDAGRLADLTGQNVIDAFPARDLAQEGAGGPLDPLCDWLLLHDASKTRVVVDLGRDVRLTYLPAARDPAGVDRVTNWRISPGLSLIDRFAREATGGRRRYDDGGHLAVQGQCLEALVELWQAEKPSPVLPGPRWRSAGGSVKHMFESAMAAAPRAGWSVTDMLCTANHVLARAIVLAIRDRLPANPAVDEVVISGGGQHNGLLVQALTQRLAGLPLLAESQLGVPTGMRGAAVAGVLALLHLDQTPACPTAITGARTPRVLGRLTPGSPQSWQRVLREMTTQQPATVSLRSAI
jgi:anhydro-N-acetylmuramic acid kinase